MCSGSCGLFGRLWPVPAAGFSQTLVEYTYVDDAPIKGVNYYRLEQVDVSGERSFSNVVTAVYQRGRIHMDV